MRAEATARKVKEGRSKRPTWLSETKCGGHKTSAFLMRKQCMCAISWISFGM